jgi:foldase protein PrsA
MATVMKVVRVGVVLASLALAGCGDAVPGDVVATVDGQAIPRAEFDRWLTITTKSSAAPDAQVPDPPRYERCVAAKRAQQQDAKAPELERQCREEYTVLRDQTMRLLITRRWFEGEARTLGVRLSDAEVTKAFDAQRQESFPRQADFEKFLRQTGQTREDVKARVRLDLLSKRIRAAIVDRQDAVSDAAVAKFYERKGGELAVPEKRDLRVVVTAGEAEARKARRALAGGASWASVVRRYSIDEVTRSYDGKLSGQAKGTLDASLDKAVFSARRGALSQPVKTPYGFYVFTVTSITEPQGQSLAESSDTIRKTLEAERDRAAVNAFVNRLKARWKQQTDCREGYATVECRNGPKERPKPPEISILD